MRKGMFDFNGDGKLDPYEQAAEWQFIDEVILKEESAGQQRNPLEEPAALKRPEALPCREKEIRGISFLGKQIYDATKDSDGVKILKSLAVIALCIGGIALPIALDMGDLGMCICMLAGPALSVLILKNT